MDNNTVEPRILSGFLELLPKEQVIFNAMLDKIRATFVSGGFFPIETPLLELSEVLLAKAGGETEKQIYEVKKGDNNLCLRFDHTVPLARYVAEHYGELSFPFKRYAIGKVYRGERPQKGRFREFYQCDVDIIGDEKLSVHADAECAKTIYNLLTSLGFKLGEFIIRINNRKILNGFMEMIGEKEKTTEILHIVDKYDKIGPDAVEEMLLDLGIRGKSVDEIMFLISLEEEQKELLKTLDFFSKGKRKLIDEKIKQIDEIEKVKNNFEDDVEKILFEANLKNPEPDKLASVIGKHDELKKHYEEYIDWLKKFGFDVEPNETFIEGVSELRQVYETLEAMRIPREAYVFDIKTVRGLDYYTGTVYEAYLTKHKEFGAVCSGGRYDNLASYYTNKKLPGVGVSLGLTRFFSCLRENNMLEGGYQSPMQVAVIPFGSEFINPCYRLASALEESGIKAEVYSFEKSFKAKLNMANKMEVPYVILVGEDEVKTNRFPLKDMKSGEQEKLTENEMIQKLKK